MSGISAFGAVFADCLIFDRLLGLEAPDLNTQATKYLAGLQIADKVQVRDRALSSTELSQGQRKQLALLTSWLEDRPSYFSDEWAAEQDPAFRDVFYHEVLPALQQRGKTTILITHDDRSDLAQQYATQIAAHLRGLQRSKLDTRTRMTSPQRSTGRWVLRPAPKTNPTVRLFCFHHAGGAPDLFSSWTRVLDPLIELALIQLPGRASRFREPAITSMDSAVQQLAEALDPLFERPFAFFGHSMGALIAFELALFLEARRLYPEHLFLSGCPAPQRTQSTRRISAMNDRQLVEFLSAMNGTPQDVLAHPELLGLIIPLVRADYQLLETYSFKPGVRLRAPLSLLLGSNDPETGPADVGLWGELTLARCKMRQFEGDHFFIKAEPKSITAWISSTLLRQPTIGP